MAIVLSDDGTMDTVLRCTECGEEFRFNFDPGPYDDGDACAHGLQADAGCEDCYNEWIDSCIEDAEADHECPRYHVATWFERDWAHVALYYGTAGDANDETIVEWWDEAVGEAIEDGFLDPKDWLASALAYARSVGLAK